MKGIISVLIVNRQFQICLCFSIMLALLPLSLAQANDFTAWTDSTSNPLFIGGPTSGVDRAYYPSVIKVGSVYHIWYGDGNNTRHASSTNLDFSGVIFPAPTVTGLLATGPYHPRVLYNASGWYIGGVDVNHYYAGPFLMYYTDGATWNSTRVAHSANGNLWLDIGPCNGVHLYAGGVIYNFDVLYEGGTTWKAYADNGGGQIEYYISSDGITWTGTAHNILGSLQPWETWFTSPHVIKSGSQYIMYYGSGGPGSNQGIGVAFSTDGQNFTKSSSNPIFSTSSAPPWRNDRTYTPFVILDGTSWTMYYSGRSTAGVYSIGYALPMPLPPTGSITINSGDASTNSTSVTLSLSCSDSTGCSQMCIKNTNSSCLLLDWESYSSSKLWTLPAGDGTKTVYARFKNNVGNENTLPFADSIILDTSVPTPSGANVTVTFPNGASVTYINVVLACYTTFTDISNPTHNPPPNFNFVRYGYFDISTDCSSYTGPVTVVYPYDESQISGQERNLKLFHWKNNGWEDCTVSVDTVNNTITGRVTSLSDFGMGYYYSSGGGGGGGGGSGGSGGGYSTGANENMIALIAILAISAGLFLLRRKRWLRKT